MPTAIKPNTSRAPARRNHVTDLAAYRVAHAGRHAALNISADAAASVVSMELYYAELLEQAHKLRSLRIIMSLAKRFRVSDDDLIRYLWANRGEPTNPRPAA